MPAKLFAQYNSQTVSQDRYQEAFKAASAATLACIRNDRARGPKALKRLFTVIADKLFSSKLNVESALKRARIGDHSIGELFKATTGKTIREYIAYRRVQVGHVMMKTTDLDLGSISEMLGYLYYPTFTENYKAFNDGKAPSEVDRAPMGRALIDVDTGLRACYGLLDDTAASRFREQLRELYPRSFSGTTEEAAESADRDVRKIVVVDGAGEDRMRAECLWRKIRELPFEEQRRRLRGRLFCSTVLFDLLRKHSRLEGRKSRRRGVEIAKLALVSLEDADEAFGDRIFDLRALGWAWLGNAYRLALDFSKAAAAFEQADREWSRTRAQRDERVLATMCALKGSLLLVRREYAAARRELDRSCDVYRQLKMAKDEARELITRATIHGYAGQLVEAVEDLQEAARLIDGEEKGLAVLIQGNLANALARAGDGRAAEELAKAQELERAVEDPLEGESRVVRRAKLDWIDGLIRENAGDLEAAKERYASAGAAFCDAEEQRYHCLVSVDLMNVLALRGDWERVLALAGETLPHLESWNLHPESIAAVKLLGEAIEAKSFSGRIVNGLRDALRGDPLVLAA